MCLKNLLKNRSLKNRGSGEDSSEERSVKTETLDEGEDWEKTAESEKKSNSSKKGDADKGLEKDDETEVPDVDGVEVAAKKTPTKKIKKEKNGSGDDEVGTDKEEGVVSGDDEIETDDKETTKDKTETIPKNRFTGKTFIKLTCIQCEVKCFTFKVTTSSHSSPNS